LSEHHLHIISFDVPWPANYGGVIDVFYKMKALHALGVKIHLHSYEYGRKPAPELEAITEEVSYYPRRVAKSNLFKRQPYIVASRNSSELLENLLKDDYPILFEGLHSCYYLSAPELAGRTKIVRAHNVEHEYYNKLGEAERNIFKRYYFMNEAQKLERFENELSYATAIAAISPAEHQHFQSLYGNTFYLPAFHAQNHVTSLEGSGEYALYHGNLSVAENDQAAIYLVKQVFSRISIPLVIAGNDPSKELKDLVLQYPHVSLRRNVSVPQIEQLVSEAHINVLPTFQGTGIKLKLLNALYNGRHCIVNNTMVEGTGLEELTIVADKAEEMAIQIESTMKEAFTKPMIAHRQNVLQEKFSVEKSALMLFRRLFEGR
jgi:hypothetical protein